MRVLIVDDDEDVRSFLVSCMQSAGCDDVDTAGTGEEALARAVQNRYDLVTLDIKMPGVSGLDILSVIRGMMPWSVIAIVSGYTEDTSDVALESTDVVLSKPVRVEIMQELVRIAGELKEKRASIRALGDEGQA